MDHIKLYKQNYCQQKAAVGAVAVVAAVVSVLHCTGLLRIFIVRPIVYI